MITKQDLEEAIAECQGQRNPNASTCLKLAAFYTIRKELFGNPEPMYSYAPAPVYYGDSDFLKEAEGKPVEAVMKIMDELQGLSQFYGPLFCFQIYTSLKYDKGIYFEFSKIAQGIIDSYPTALLVHEDDIELEELASIINDDGELRE